MTQNAADISSENPEASILIVGDSGTHKTHFLSTIPGIYVFDFDKGMAVARGKDVPYDTFKDAPHKSKAVSKKAGIYPWGEGWLAFLKQLNMLGELIDKGEFPYKAVGLDSMTTFATLALNYVMSSAGRGAADDVRIQDWGNMIRLIETIMDQLTAWPIMVVATAHVQREVNGLNESIELLPLLPGKSLPGKLPVYFDEVYYTKALKKDDSEVFTLITRTQGMFRQAKTRYGVPDGSPTDWAAIKQYFGA